MTSTTTLDAPVRRRSFRKGIAGALAATGIVAGAVVGVAAPAHAATGTGYVAACFTNYLYGVSAPMENRIVYLDAYYNGGWYQISSYITKRNGCLDWIGVTSGYNWRFRVSLRENQYYYNGTGRTVYVGGTGYYDLGPVNVLITR
jgi:hypothetical protein